MVTGVMPFDSGREVIKWDYGWRTECGQDMPLYCQFKSSFTKKRKKVKPFSRSARKGLLNREGCTWGQGCMAWR